MMTGWAGLDSCLTSTFFTLNFSPTRAATRAELLLWRMEDLRLLLSVLLLAALSLVFYAFGPALSCADV